jgi:hypothetical protein
VVDVCEHAGLETLNESWELNSERSSSFERTFQGEVDAGGRHIDDTARQRLADGAFTRVADCEQAARQAEPRSPFDPLGLVNRLVVVRGLEVR